MLTILASAVRLTLSAVQGVLAAACGLGRLLYTAAASILLAVGAVADGAASFLRVLYEDNEALLREELPGSAARLGALCGSQLGALWGALEAAAGVAQVAADGLAAAAAELAYGLAAAALAGARALAAAGWWLATFVPLQAPLVAGAGWALVRRAAPWVCAVAAAAAVWRAVRGRLHGWMRAGLHGVRAGWWRLRLARCPELAPLRSLQGRGPTETAAAGEGAACVVCRERERCVLTLPCRHVCMCQSCCRRMYGSQRTCPLCRTFIFHSVNIYL